ncbi:MAG: CADD family putative folate metabolism protein [Chloroflexi bacterium]|nr:CADD family putative folate metabolism protein [Chloroflexota bacterium]
MDLLSRIDRLIDDRHLLTHPFYTKWADGTLPKEALQEYARQYYAFEATFPRLLSTLHSRTEAPAIRQEILENLWDEEHGAVNHAEMWLRFAEGIGVSRDDVRTARPNEATEALLQQYREVTTEAPVAAGVAAVYAYERQVPEVAESKIAGLRKHYEIDDARTLQFFKVHGVLDVAHSGAERRMLGELVVGEDETVITDATERALNAWWDFLTAVDQPLSVPAAA